MDEACSFDEEKGLLCVTGELTIYQVAGVFDTLRNAAASGVLCEIDLTEVTELDGAGLQWLVQAERLVRSQPEPAIVLRKNELIEALQQLTRTTTNTDLPDPDMEVSP
jgi:ABC-type transporter Mla MlaB component